MKWTEFLREISGKDSVNLIGPLQSSVFSGQGPAIYVDGGARFMRGAGDLEVSVGDGDSVGGVTLDELLPTDKDFSDLAFALRALPQSIGLVRMFGFMGGRRDHEYCNIGEVHDFLASRSHFTRVELDDEIIGFCKGRVSLEVSGLFSVLVLEPTAVKITGACKYPLNRERVLGAFSSVGLSNVGSGLVEIESGPPAFVILPGSLD